MSIHLSRDVFNPALSLIGVDICSHEPSLSLNYNNIMVTEATLRTDMSDECRRQHDVVREQTMMKMKMMKMMMGRKRDKTLRRRRLVGQNVVVKYQRAAANRQAEYRRLKAIVPSVADRKTVSKVWLMSVVSASQLGVSTTDRVTTLSHHHHDIICRLVVHLGLL